MSKRPINVTEPYLPPLEEYVEHLKGVWDRNYLTNQGPLVKELESKLQAYHNLSVPVHCVANGALGLQIALKALGVKGEVITTPFSYVATTSCPLWEGCSVKFADIEADSLTIDPKAVEAAISPRTEAILATHVFGNPCDVEVLEVIARKHNLALIYDAAHAFGVTYKGRSILEWGDASMVSTHATKIFHTVEGGFICAKNTAISVKMEWMRRFGHRGYDGFHGVALNAKLTEVHAAMGLAVLADMEKILSTRKNLVEYYIRHLANSDRVTSALNLRSETLWNYSYFPVLCESETALLELVKAMNAKGVFPRRYFHPSLHSVIELGCSASDCPISRNTSSRVLCLPLAATYTESDLVCVINSIHDE